MLWLLRNSKALISSSKALISSCFFILVCQENLIAALPLLSHNMQCGSDEDLCMTVLLSVYGLPGPKYYLLCFFRHVSKMLQAGNFCWSLRSPNVQEDALTTCWLKLGGQKAWPSSALLVHRCLSRTGILCETRLLCDPRAGSAPARGARPGHFQGCSHREAWGASSGNPLRCWGKSPPYTEGLTHPRGACGSARGQAGHCCSAGKGQCMKWQRSSECSEVCPYTKKCCFEHLFLELGLCHWSSQCCCCGSYSLGWYLKWFPMGFLNNSVRDLSGQSDFFSQVSEWEDFHTRSLIDFKDFYTLSFCIS